MSSVGPQLPPELQKRKRKTEDDDEENNSSDSSTGPLPPQAHTQGRSPPSPKRTRVIGPSLPPAPLDERPSDPPQPDIDQDEGDSSDDDDDFGPSLPSAADSIKTSSNGPQVPQDSTGAPAPAQRDEWMTLAPASDDWSSRVDPTKLKNRKFNTGRGSKAPPKPPSGGDQSWHETPAEKQARLKREVMGIKDSATTTGPKHEANAHDEETARRLKEYNEKQRGTSLYASHNASSKPIEEDDPSARAFDREKDIAGGMTINATKRREMLKKASDFSTRFGESRYL